MVSSTCIQEAAGRHIIIIRTCRFWPVFQQKIFAFRIVWRWYGYFYKSIAGLRISIHGYFSFFHWNIWSISRKNNGIGNASWILLQTSIWLGFDPSDPWIYPLIHKAPVTDAGFKITGISPIEVRKPQLMPYSWQITLKDPYITILRTCFRHESRICYGFSVSRNACNFV